MGSHSSFAKKRKTITAEPAAKPATPVPENVLKKRRTTEKLAARRANRAKALKKKRAAARKTAFKRAETYIKEYRARETALIRAKRQAKKAGNFYREPEAKFAFVVRIRGYVASILHTLFYSLFLSQYQRRRSQNKKNFTTPSSPPNSQR